MSLPVATLLAVSLFGSGPIDLYAPTGTAIAVQSPADPALPEGCYGVATADRTGLTEEEPSVWACEVPADGTDVLASADLVGGSGLPVLLRWAGSEWMRYADAPVAPPPEELVRIVKHVQTTDATPVVVWSTYLPRSAPVDGDGERAVMECYVTQRQPVDPPWAGPQYWPFIRVENWCQNPGPQPPNGWNYDGWCASRTTNYPPVGHPLYGLYAGITYSFGYIGTPGFMVRGPAGAILNWVCEVTVMRTRGTP